MQPDNKTAETPDQNEQASVKELNFRALEQKYNRQLENERAARMEAERMANEAREMIQQSQKHTQDDDDDTSDPYVDHKKLTKKLTRHGEQIQQQTKAEIQKAVQTAINEERKENYLKQNKDFFDVIAHAEKLMQHDPDLCESILSMPESFERQKLVYKNIKALGLHQDKPKEPSIQEKIDRNRQSPYYQPSQAGNAPYNGGGDFSQSGQKAAYEKMQDLKKRMRLG